MIAKMLILTGIVMGSAGLFHTVKGKGLRIVTGIFLAAAAIYYGVSFAAFYVFYFDIGKMSEDTFFGIWTMMFWLCVFLALALIVLFVFYVLGRFYEKFRCESRVMKAGLIFTLGPLSQFAAMNIFMKAPGAIDIVVPWVCQF